ncbi:MAG: exodeoxyribonuclease VII small subunit [Verrucomicrobiales bacterium]|nr:exodeoxyribonuclease VII small subunit [Verrucomicrobiales bacterium]
MSKAAKATEPSFEDALGKLEAIVEAMEGGDLPLEQLLARYEEGARLVKFCQDRLSAAELRLQELEPQGTAEAGGSEDDDDEPGEGDREPR